MEHATIQKPIIVAERHVSCAGEGGALGHPKIYLEISTNDEIECPYCGQTFIYRPN
jgi:uncharacterized Zn-finger protein